MIRFSNNGYHLAASVDKKILLFDLRKQKCINTLEFEAPITSCAFDSSGQFFAAGDAKGKILSFSSKSKQYKSLGTHVGHTATITGLKFGPNASYLVSSSLDRALILHK